MNKMCTLLIIACVGAIAFFVAHITHKRLTHNRSMTFRELMQDNESAIDLTTYN